MKKAVMMMVLLMALPCFAAMQGDFDNSGKVEPNDAVLGLQVTAQLRTAAELGYTGNIGLPEVISILRILVGIIPPPSEFTNSLGMVFKLIQPSGPFMMGSPQTEWGRSSNETQHQVTLTKSYYIQTTEVTQEQWITVMGSNPSYFKTCGNTCPVEAFTWNDMKSFIEKMNQRNEGTYRLPTEAEWEYAARAGTATAIPTGDITKQYCNDPDPNMNLIAWFCGDLAGDKTHPVASKQANAWGLYDMAGNVWEWVSDTYGCYGSSPVTDPACPVNLYGTGVNRGGSWLDSAFDCRSARRLSTNIYNGITDTADSKVGFRLVRNP